MLTLACLVMSVASVRLCSKTLVGDIKPSYLVMDSDGNPGNYSFGSDDNFFQMDCTGCFPEGKLISMYIKDITENCRTYGDTSHSKKKSVADIYCRPCDNYDLEVSAKVVIDGVSECVKRIFKYRKDVCPSNAQAIPIEATTFEPSPPSSINSSNNSRTSGINFLLNATMFTLLLLNLHISSVISVFNKCN